ncbi:MAG TPA: hypothetical protein VK541_24685 [Pedobacter sp.]|uniref:hypothetical protein n=1 Tax=Pedobacter sp. TaxID=1411316 RepID=UPI002C5E2745|nr:hypothetical protein [Pedobacter sp.]HMI05708.1 hypothetical protein [Pedobacter sp.]
MLKKIIGALSLSSEDKRSLKLLKENKESFDQFIEYLGFKTNLPSLHIIKQNNIHAYRDQLKFTVLVETGTYLGDMVEAQKAYFEQVYSVELDETLHKRAVERFKADPGVKILQGDSGVVLKSLLEKLHVPALFWLDGHYSSGITAKSDKNTPILNELEAILGSALYHGILIDDARLFVGKDDYPTVDELCDFVKAKDPARTVTVADDIIRIF